MYSSNVLATAHLQYGRIWFVLPDGTTSFILKAADKRHETRGTEFLKHKDRVTMVLSCNADGSHILPVRYIVASANPRCFRTGRYYHCQPRYTSQRNEWMDSSRFTYWLNWYHAQITQNSSGP